jgi:tetratricopeptide (TPR) repeat protein
MQSRLERQRRRQRTERIILVVGGILLLVGLVVLLYQVPAIQTRLDWRIETARVFLRSLAKPIRPVPTAMDSPAAATLHSTPLTPSPEPTPTASEQPADLTGTGQPAEPASPTTAPVPTSTKVVLAAQVSLEAPRFEGQDWNNCGPVSLSMYLNYYGWEGDQYDISDQVKPLRADRNVNIDELVNYVSQNIWWLKATYRVGGSIDQLRGLINAGFPVMVEETMYMEEEYWFNDDRWAGHYLLLTGYDDVHQTFTSQDSFVGPNRPVSYRDLDANWQAFNRAYLLVYLPEQEVMVKNVLGENWDVEKNRTKALETARLETQSEPKNPFAWFNLGSNLLYFEKYGEAAAAYDQARKLPLPQRMLRYQFGPFLAYFHTGRYDELLALAEYALSVTPNSEEALLWKGWALYRLNRQAEAAQFFQKALEIRPDYSDAVYALNFVQGQ